MYSIVKLNRGTVYLLDGAIIPSIKRIEEILDKISSASYILILDNVCGSITDINYDIGTGYIVSENSSFYMTQDLANSMEISKNITEQLPDAAIYCYLPLAVNTGINSTLKKCKEVVKEDTRINIIVITVFILILIVMIIWIIYSNVLVISNKPSM